MLKRNVQFAFGTQSLYSYIPGNACYLFILTGLFLVCPGSTETETLCLTCAFKHVDVRKLIQ